MTIKELCVSLHDTAVEKGFYDSDRNKGEVLALAIGELYEGLEGHRKGDMDNFAEEMADTFIRLFDMAAAFDLSLQVIGDLTLNEVIDNNLINDLPTAEDIKMEDNLGALLLHVNLLLCDYYFNDMELWLEDACVVLAYICKKFDIDIEAEIEKKASYNKTRPYKHGKNY